MLLVFAAMPMLVMADQASSSQVISEAKQQLLNCYSAARDAEAAGANITGLAGKLNEAASLLDHAEWAYSAGDFDAAASYAQASQAKLSGFISEATALRSSAVQQGSFDFWVYTVGSIAGAIAIIGVGAAIWVWSARKSKPIGGSANGEFPAV